MIVLVPERDVMMQLRPYASAYRISDSRKICSRSSKSAATSLLLSCRVANRRIRYLCAIFPMVVGNISSPAAFSSPNGFDICMCRIFKPSGICSQTKVQRCCTCRKNSTLSSVVTRYRPATVQMVPVFCTTKNSCSIR